MEECRTYGYVRVSTKEQNEARQHAAMEAFGVARGRVYIDRQSSKDFDRPMYRRLVRRLRPGDTLVVKSIDRLGRNYDEILAQWRAITKERRAAIVVLDMPLLDTRQGRDLTGTLTADIVLQLLSYVAQVEREFIRRRQAEGIAAARKAGVRFGPPPKSRPECLADFARRWQRGELTSREGASALGIHHKTFIRWAREVL